MNLVERWFAELTNKQIRRVVHRPVEALEKDIRIWIAAWNTDPKPYVWTKSADEILERLASCLDAGDTVTCGRQSTGDGNPASVPQIQHRAANRDTTGQFAEPGLVQRLGGVRLGMAKRERVVPAPDQFFGIFNVHAGALWPPTVRGRERFSRRLITCPAQIRELLLGHRRCT
ncbi:hypothetical protein GCM10010207_50700 [Streptomyces atratus]|nr:hypothetical protein GCM10010207_50700 [Streptomyces atratus]